VDTVERSQYYFALALSFAGHTIMAVLLLFSFGSSATFKSGVVYSVTIEGGKQLGGISQVASTDKATPVAPPKNISNDAEVESKKEKAVESREPEEKVEDAEVSLAEKRKEEEKKKEQKRLAEEQQKKKAEELKKKQADEKRKKDDAKKKAAAQPADISKDYQKALQRYLGESSEAGGKGFGAAKVGGSGMGGGVVMPPEFFTYRQILRNKVKSGWNWFNTSAALTTWVTFEISQEGAISNVEVAESSGNREYDQSVLRALYKASPLPPPPASVYQHFRAVKMSFDPRD